LILDNMVNFYLNTRGSYSTAFTVNCITA